MAISWPRMTARLRLTLAYTALFVVTGTALIGVSYILVEHRGSGSATDVQIICSRTVAAGVSMRVLTSS